MRWLPLIFLAACFTPRPLVYDDAGTDAGQVDAGFDAGQDAGTDAGQDAGPSCECSGGACCDGCHFLPTSTVCSSVSAHAYPDYCTFVSGSTREYLGLDETITRCGSSGACDGVVSVVEHRWVCPVGYVCSIRPSDMQAICQ